VNLLDGNVCWCFIKTLRDGKLIAIVLLKKEQKEPGYTEPLRKILAGAYGTVRVWRGSSDTLEATMLVATKRN